MIRVFTAPAVAILLAIALMLWCDIELVIDAVMHFRHKAPQVPPRPANLDWVVWIAALALTSYFFWGSVRALVPYRLYGRLDILQLSAGFLAVTILF